MRNSVSTPPATSQSIELPTYPVAAQPCPTRKADQAPNPSACAPAAPTTPQQTSCPRKIFPHLRHWWAHTVCITIPQDADFRDFLGLYRLVLQSNLHPALLNSHSPTTALERTYLAFARTALALAMLSVLVSQLYIISDTQDPAAPGLTFQQAGKPLALSLAGGSIIVTTIGGVRYMRQQNAILHGKVFSGGVDFVVMWVLGVGVSFGFLASGPDMLVRGFLEWTID
jgi:uncharacterized membrane protein YidH (DUF202 family)